MHVYQLPQIIFLCPSVLDNWYSHQVIIQPIFIFHVFYNFFFINAYSNFITWVVGDRERYYSLLLSYYVIFLVNWIKVYVTPKKQLYHMKSHLNFLKKNVRFSNGLYNSMIKRAIISIILFEFWMWYETLKALHICIYPTGHETYKNSKPWDQFLCRSRYAIEIDIGFRCAN